MIVRIKIYGSLRYCVLVPSSLLQGDKFFIPDQATVDYVLEMLNIPRQASPNFLINGKHAKSDSVLNEGDVLHIMPPMTGG